MAGISCLPNPFEFAASSPANNPAASKRLDKPVDAAGSSTPLGGTATAPGMARGSNSVSAFVACVPAASCVDAPPSADALGDAGAAASRFELDELAFFRAIAASEPLININP